MKPRYRRKPHGKPRQGAEQKAKGNRSPRGKGPQGGRPRHFYDVRQYALLTDEAGHILILQLPGEYDAGAANTWTLPGGKLEPTDEPGAGLLREITEETGLEATLRGPCAVKRWTTRNSKKLGIFYHAVARGTKPGLKLSNEHQRAVWISPAEVAEFPFHRPEMAEVVTAAAK